jgi:hypothetical protein
VNCIEGFSVIGSLVCRIEEVSKFWRVEVISPNLTFFELTFRYTILMTDGVPLQRHVVVPTHLPHRALTNAVS